MSINEPWETNPHLRIKKSVLMGLSPRHFSENSILNINMHCLLNLIYEYHKLNTWIDYTVFQKSGLKNEDLTTNSGPIFDTEFKNHSHFSLKRTDFL